MRKPTAKSLSDLLGPVLRPALEKHGLATSQLITSWREIAGEDLASVTRVLRISWPTGGPARGENADAHGAARVSGGTLVLQVESAFALDVQHEAPQILERVNALYGWHAVTKLQLRQGPVEAAAMPLEPAPVAKAPDLPQIEDEKLREALRRLGQSVAATNK